MKYIIVTNVQSDKREVINVDHITNITIGGGGHCHLHFINGHNSVVKFTLAELVKLLQAVGHSVLETDPNEPAIVPNKLEGKVTK